MEKELFNTVIKIIKLESQRLVGELCKKVEVLEKNQTLTPKLYKDLSKEHVYEFSRQLIKLLELHIQIGKIKFTSRPKE